jgi:FkbM family methyltransferase
MKYNLIIVFIIIVCLFYIYENYNDKFKFKLYNINGQLINNENWEYSEQKLLIKYLKKTDNVLQLGGNIGASCIMVDKLLNRNNINICVEPNNKIINTLNKNKNYNKSKFIIVNGIISNKDGLKLSDEGESDKLNYWGSKITKDKGNIVKSYRLNNVENINKINVLFADCEGCLESFIDDYEYFLKQLRLVIYEADHKHICNYDKIEKILKKNNFKNIEVNGQNYVWEINI